MMRSNRVAFKRVVALFVFLFVVATTTYAETDFSWKTGSPYPGINGNIYDTVVWNGNLVFGGQFDIAGDKVVSNIALWDGAEFHSLGGGMNGIVYALEVYESSPGNNWLVASGSFTTAGGVPVNNIARWSFGWHSLGSGLSGPVYALTVHNGNLIAGGDFNMPGGGSDIAQWNADANVWMTMFAAVYDSTLVHQLISFNGRLYAEIWYSEGPNISGIWQKDDFATWVYHGLSDTLITDLKVINNRLFAGCVYEDWIEDPEFGFFLLGSIPYVMSTDGLTWEGHPISNYFSSPNTFESSSVSLLGFNDLLIASTDLDFVQWDIDGKVDVPPYYPPFNRNGLLSVYKNQIVCGDRQWDGDQWLSINRKGLPAIDCFATYNGKLTTIVRFFDTYDSSDSFLLEWEGISNWKTVCDSGYLIFKPLFVYDNQLVGVKYTPYVSNAYQLMTWNGSSWQFLAEAVNRDIATVSLYNGNLIAGGMFTSAGVTDANYVAQWDGSAWLPMGDGLTGGVDSSVIFENNIVVGGAFECTDGINTSNVARWDGMAWNPVGNNFDGSVDNFTIYNGELIASGYLSVHGSPSNYNIARWDGSTWTLFGNGLNGHINSMTIFNNELIIGGHFTQVGGIQSPYIARWDGMTWKTCGNTFNNYITALTVFNGELIAGGYFTKIDDEVAVSFARWGQPEWNVGDFNHDGLYTIDDLAHLCTQWLRGDCQQTGWCLEADLNYSNTVDLEDFLIFSENWNKSN